EASRRLGLLGLMYSAVYALAFYGSSIPAWFREGGAPEYLRGMSGIISNIFIALGIAVWLAVRHLKLPPHRLLDLGLIFEVVAALGIGLPQIWGLYPEYTPAVFNSGHYVGVPWECIWILIFPLIAPNSPGKTLIASLLAAAMPAAVLTASKFYGPTDRALPLLPFYNYYLFTTFLCALQAVIISRMVFRYGARLRKAQEMGQYRLTRLIGRGGMGEVWRAEHRMLARPAAVKLIRPDSLQGDTTARLAQLRRFEREARATAALRSVHSIDVYDFGITPDSSFYYVMELLEGQDMDSFVKHFGPLPPGRALHWLRQACHALEDAHGRGLIHRDLKPANLFICRLGPDCDFVKVLDYGLVKDSDRNAAETQLTRDGLAFGTPGYMAPEMAMGAGAADARSDIYALGCVGYFLLTGVQVFEGETPLATVLKHVKDEPLPPSQRSETPVPADLEGVIMACLAKEPGARPISAAMLADRLAACRDAATWSPRQAREWWDLHLPADPSMGLPRPAAASARR
ncbi:serine/threonine protein kinase, partial [bacterium]|nr:serine/threonine protein kinase [bacterium]